MLVSLILKIMEFPDGNITKSVPKSPVSVFVSLADE